MEKAIGPTEGSPVVSIPQEGTEPKRRGKARAQEPMAAAEAPEDSENGDMSESEVKAQPRKKKVGHWIAIRSRIHPNND